MEALVLNRNYDAIDIVDNFESFIWTDRFREAGDFEIYLPVSTRALDCLKIDNYLYTKNSDHYMIIEDISVDTDAEDGNHLTVTGRSLESILERRVVWRPTSLSGNLQNGVKTLLNESIISPADGRRRIPNFEFVESTDPEITKLSINTQFFGETVYDAVYTICDMYDIGFRVLPKGIGGFAFELFTGIDRSYRQNKVPWVVFSPKYDNLLSSNYYESKAKYKTAALTAGSGEGEDRKTVESVSVEYSGLDRREMFVEASGITMETRDDKGNELTGEALAAAEQKYLEELRGKGLEALSEVSVEAATEGEIDASRQFVYDKDFKMGDIVQVVNEYGMEMICRVTEIIQSHDTNGESMYPTFIQVE